MIYKLGNHILVHGDATKTPTPDMPIRMILADPPYGVAYVENKAFTKLGKKSPVPIAGDQIQTHGAYAQFTRDWLMPPLRNMEAYNTVYIFHADAMTCAIREGILASGIYYSQTLIWVKNTVVIGRKDYLAQHEFIAYGWYGKHKPERSKNKSVIFYPKPSKSKLHPTMKPLGLLRTLILQSTRQGDWVYDPFGGSGSTLIACENTMRRCYMVEMEEEYIQTIIKRWEFVTKRKAERLDK